MVVGEGLSEKQFECAAFLFLSERPHGDGGYQENKEEFRHIEQALDVGKPGEKHVVDIGKYPQEKPGHNEEYGDEDVPQYRAQEGFYFFEIQTVHFFLDLTCKDTDFFNVLIS